MTKFISKFIRFGVVGFSGFMIDFSMTWFCKDVLGIFEYVANCIGFTFGASSNYILNRKWTWKSKNPNIKREFIKFFGVSLAGLGINSLVIFICLSIGKLDFTIAEVYISEFWTAKLIATAVVMFWNFIVNNYFTFRKK